MGRADEAAIRSGTPAELLMERAGTAVARAALELLGGRYGTRAVVVCGRGNNGGDGFVAARVLARDGVSVRCGLVGDRDAIEGAARHHLDLLTTLGGEVHEFDPGSLDDAGVIVDALFGTGFRGPAEGDAAKAIDAVNNSTAPVVSVDIPSGVDGSTGGVQGAAVRADVTVVMAAEKLGTALPPGAQHAGTVRVADIGIPTAGIGHAHVLLAPRSVPRRDTTMHKRSAGSAAILAGSDAMQGAAILTVRGAQRIGAGYVTLGTTARVKSVAHGACPEALVVRVGDDDTLGPDSLDAFSEVIERADCVALGPGMGDGDRQRALIERVLAEVDTPMVLDADALNVLARDATPLVERAEKGWAEVVLTPHPAELARLLGTSTEEVQNDRLQSAMSAAKRFHATVVLKGWRSIVASDDGRAAVCPTGGPELATAGTGDVLTGAIAGLGGGFDGAAAGAYVHGLAGTVAGERTGRAGVVAWDVAEALPGAWSRISAGEDHDWLG
jgi:ADP-dependent NAD(P)H-hydrate dehydratase / NAD(P)H-hydrate epimerase